jgi:hypothetical protein
MNNDNYYKEKMQELQVHLEGTHPKTIRDIYKERPDLLVVASNHPRIRELLYFYGIPCPKEHLCIQHFFENFDDIDWAKYLAYSGDSIEEFKGLFNSVQFKNIRSRLTNIEKEYLQITNELRPESRIDFVKFKPRIYNRNKYRTEKYNEHKKKFLEVYTASDEGIINYLNVKVPLNRLEIYKDNVFAYEYITRRGSKYLKKIGFPNIEIIPLGRQREISISVKEISEIFIKKIQEEELKEFSLRKIDYPLAQFLHRYGNYWAAINYIRVRLGLFDLFNKAVVTWPIEQYELFLRTLDISPNSQEELFFIERYEDAVFFMLNEPLLCLESNRLTPGGLCDEFN